MANLSQSRERCGIDMKIVIKVASNVKEVPSIILASLTEYELHGKSNCGRWGLHISHKCSHGKLIYIIDRKKGE